MKARLLLLAPLAAVLVACHSHSIVGKWKASASGQDVTMEFKQDGTMDMKVPIMKDLDILGTYSMDGDNVALKVTKVQLGPELSKLTWLKQMIDASLKDQLNKEQKAKITWTSDDEIELSGAKLPSGPGAGGSLAAGAPSQTNAAAAGTLKLTRMKDQS